VGKLTLNIHERFLRHIWSRQYLDRLALKTTGNQVVRVLETGSLNNDGGPDFRDAVVRIDETTFHGDVEIHRTLVDWRLHGHSKDPRYNKVILHVVFERGAEPITTYASCGRTIPVLLLEPFLTESIRTLWHKTIVDEQSLLKRSIRCSSLNQSVSADLMSSWIRRLAIERLELKLRRFDERLRELAQIHILAVREHEDPRGRWRVQGDPDDVPPHLKELTQTHLAPREFWDQMLYEGLMECLGYSKNQESFLRLARAVTLQTVRSHHVEKNEEALQALLLGAAGLIPKMKTVKDRESREFVRRLNHEWRSQKAFYRSSVLHAADWQFFPTRPVNFPTLRMAAATPLVHKIICDDLFRRIVENLKTPEGKTREIQTLRKLLAVQPLPYWTRHYRFDYPSSKPVHPLGPERTDAAITNVIVPLSLLYARIFKDRIVREGALRLFDSMPPPAENSITRVMENHLLKGRLKITSVSAQQGVIQLYKFYCSEERCAECDIGAIVFTNTLES
jgi:hypothetical protein